MFYFITMYGHCQADRNAKQAKNKMQPVVFESTASNSADGQFQIYSVVSCLHVWSHKKIEFCRVPEVVNITSSRLHKHCSKSKEMQMFYMYTNQFDVPCVEIIYM